MRPFDFTVGDCDADWVARPHMPQEAPKMSEKLCVFCAYFGWNDISMYDYGGMTGAGIDGGGLKCHKGMISVLRWKKNRWEKRPPLPDPREEYLPGDTEDFREVIQIAAKCPHYKPPK